VRLRHVIWYCVPACLLLAFAGSAWSQQPSTRSTTRRPAARSTASPARTTVRPVVQPAPAPGGRVLATVNGSVIDEVHFRKAIEDKWGKQVLDDIIRDRLVRQEARARNIKVSTQEIDAAMQQERSGYVSESEFLAMLEDKGYTVAGFRKDIETKLLLDRLAAGKATVTQAEVQKYYDAHRADYSAPAKIHLFDIVTATSEDAYQARERIAKGDAFAAVAAEMSSDKDTAQKGGERGLLGREDITDPVLREVAFSLKEGDISNPVQSGDHFHILYVKDKQAETVRPLTEVNAEILAKLSSMKASSTDDYVRSLARKANITVAWTPLKYIETVYADLKAIQIVVDSKPLKLAEHPVILPNGSMLVPAKPVLGAAHIQLSWNPAAQQLIAATKASKVTMTVGSPTATVDGKPLRLPEGPQLRNGHLYIPPRAIIEALGGAVGWDAARNSVIVTSPTAHRAEAPTPQPTVAAPGAALPPGTTDDTPPVPATTPATSAPSVSE
jgi:foldase protein PrsA